MAQWIPLLQGLIWPLLLGGILIWLSPEIARLVKVLSDRIEKGDSFEAGAAGFKLGGAQEKLPLEPANVAAAAAAKNTFDETIPHQIYLVHEAARDKSLDKNRHAYYRVRVWLDADSPEFLSDIESVTYHLHSTFKNPERTVRAPETRFTLETAAWGEFLIFADVRMKDKRRAIRIERYLSF